MCVYTREDRLAEADEGVCGREGGLWCDLLLLARSRKQGGLETRCCNSQCLFLVVWPVSASLSTVFQSFHSLRKMHKRGIKCPEHQHKGDILH